jgi:pyruvate dehydrogenase E2 component (dihydrolipoamide acetyltransferase)
MPTEFHVPELGESVKGGDVLRVLVKPGDTVTKDQPVLELETDKATIEVPSSVEGKVVAVHVKPGDKVTVGQSVLAVEGGAGTGAAAPAPAQAQAATEAARSDDTTPAPVATPASQTEPARTETPAAAAASSGGQAPSPGTVTFEIPNLGENVKGGDVLRVLVKVGDTVDTDQPLVELETDKATIEVPSTVAGKVASIAVKAGDKVSVGQTVMTFEAAAGQASAPAAAPAAATQSGTVSDFPPTRAAESRGRSGPAEVVDISRGARQQPAVAAAAAPDVPGRDTRGPAPAAPSVRRLARELGVDIHEVPGSGPGGRISAADVTQHAKRIITSRGASGASAAGVAVPEVVLPDFSKWGPIERQPLRAIRRKAAEQLSTAWRLVPHVTQGEKADITDLDAMRGRFSKLAESAGGKLTVTAVTLKIVAAALKKFPQFNASLDLATETVVYKQYVHVGVAVDTDRGLLVPVVRDVDTKGILQLAAELQQLAEKARSGKLSLDEMQGGCFTISNLGGIGGTHFSPIVNYPEVSILGMSRARMEPVWKDGQFVPRLLIPLSLSYDHRLIDGADGIRFLRFIVDALEQPFLLVLQ